MKQFDIPTFYRSPVIAKVKAIRKAQDPRKKDYSPAILDYGPVHIHLARHFGFCYGVENAVEIAYKTIEANPDKRIFLLSEMIHNQEVNADLQSRGLRFIMDTYGKQLIPWEELTPEDIVIVPAFGTTLEVKAKLRELGIEPDTWDTTCPFVVKVWNRATSLGEKAHTIVVHGKYKHEETRATFSHSKENAPTVVVRDMDETKILAEYIKGERAPETFFETFKDKYSDGFDPVKDLQRIAVVNQTTMLASETQAIADYLKQSIIQRYSEENYKDHFADTRDTLCYATNDNQRATYGMLEVPADLAIVVGGYNSSNTSHLVELCEEKFPTFFINHPDKLLSPERICHFDFRNKQELETEGWLSRKRPARIIITSGASCPDSLLDAVLQRVLSFFPGARDSELAVAELEQALL